MPVTDTELEVIFRYFDGDLSAEEEEQLLKELQQNADLQQAFDQQILMQKLRPDEEVVPLVSTGMESADDFLKKVTGAMEAGQKPAMVAPLPVVNSNKVWMVAAAAVVVGMLAVSIYFINRKKVDNTVLKIPGKDSVALIKPPAPKKLQNEPLPESTVNLQQLYADNYNTFTGIELDIPPAAKMYESEYKQGNYQELATLPESILGTKGNDDPGEEAEIANYFHFYKALAALQVGDTTTAGNLLKKLLTGNSDKMELGNPVKWYLLMTYLKSNNNVAALEMSTAIANTKNSKYQKQAAQIKEKLNR